MVHVAQHANHKLLRKIINVALSAQQKKKRLNTRLRSGVAPRKSAEWLQ